MKAPILEQIKESFGYEWVGPFSEGLAVATKSGQCFHIRPDGTPAYQQRYDYVGPFSGGLAQATKDGQQFRIRPDGTRAK